MKDELIKALEEYIVFLKQEMDDLAVLVSVHGWKSSRVEQGKKMRDNIRELRLKINDTSACDYPVNVYEPVHYCKRCGKYHN